VVWGGVIGCVGDGEVVGIVKNYNTPREKIGGGEGKFGGKLSFHLLSFFTKNFKKPL